MTLCRDWRECAAADVQPLVTAEARVWLTDLHWDVSEAWRVIEPARQAGRLPGFLLSGPGGEPSGWTAFLTHHDWLQVMAVVATDRAGTTSLVEAIIASPEAAAARSAMVCVRDIAPGLAEELVGRGFRVESYRYMSTGLRGHASPDHDFETWGDCDAMAARLCGRAYHGSEHIRAFAPDGTDEEWEDYVASIRKGPGCGWFAPDLSLVARAPGGLELEAAIMVTDLGPGTAHVAQFVVDPAARRRGLGWRMLSAALGRAAMNFERATLLVSAANTPAVAMYERFGFREDARFVVATRKVVG